MLDDNPWKMFSPFVKTFPLFEFVRQYSFHLNANTAFEKLHDGSFVDVVFSDDTAIAGSTWGEIKHIAFLSDERMVGPYNWATLRSRIYSQAVPT